MLTLAPPPKSPSHWGWRTILPISPGPDLSAYSHDALNRPKQTAAPFSTPNPEAQQPRSLPRLPARGAKSSGHSLQAWPWLLGPKTQRGDRKVLQQRVGHRASRTLGPGDSQLPWPGLSPPAPPARASAACPHLIQVLVAAAVLSIRVDYDTAFPLLYHGGPPAPTPDAAGTTLLPACQWDRHCRHRRSRRRSTHTKATAHARSAPPLAPPTARRTPFANAWRPAPPHPRRSARGGATLLLVPGGSYPISFGGPGVGAASFPGILC